jgi:signal transduction histidine kinase
MNADRPFRILNVDDNPAVLYAKTRVLRRGGYEIIEAATGAEAIEQVAAHQPHLVVLDVHLPDMSGLDVCARIKEDQAAVLVLQTSATFIEARDRVAGLECGADMYLVEPISGDELLASVRALLRLHRAETEHRRLLVQEREARALADRAAEELRAANLRLEQEVGERRHIEARLREGDRRKDEFLAMLAHELRNPLAPIRSAAHLLRMQPESLQVGAIIERQVAHLARLVDDLLDVSRITRGQIRLNRAPVALQSVLGSALEAARPLIDQRRHRLDMSVPEQPLHVLGDATRLSQVVVNLLNNAAKYMAPGGSIALTLERNGEEAQIQVRDEGMGIAAELLPHVFDLFTQAERTMERSEGGLGVGLTLVRELTRMHGGQVAAHSDGLGQGSCFVVHLPLLAAQPQPASSQAAVVSAPRSGLRVLIVDDSPDVADSLQLLLDSRGYSVRTAYEGASALCAASAFDPQVVLLDIGLPHMNGLEVARALRERAAKNTPLLIAMSGYGQDADKRRSREAGFVAHLVKPIDPDELYALLDQPSPGLHPAVMKDHDLQTRE